MGEQLYGDPALAIRELYQNALDACRYREARTEYLRRTREFDDELGRADPRSRRATDEDGRPYLDCVDNGIGMGVRELCEVFSQAGVRLGDLPEFLEEQAEWARLDPPVQLFPNSRFGIGVLSYFMLADEITVDTCRLGRDGRPGQRLRVSHRRPGQPVPDPDPRPGYRVGHHDPAAPARPPRCPVWTHCARCCGWPTSTPRPSTAPSARSGCPGELSEAAGPNRQRAEERARRRPWWPTRPPACGGARARAAILADGLWAGQELTGAVVNLSRDLAPRLSVDRTKILAYREEDLERLLWQAVPALVDAGPAVLDLRLAVHVRVLPAADRRRHLRAGPGHRVHAGGTSAGTPSTPPSPAASGPTAAP